MYEGGTYIFGGMSMKQKKKVTYKITACILTLQFIVLAVLCVFVSRTITGNIRKNTIDSMQTIVDDRSQIIQSYVRETEGYLTAYSRAGELNQGTAFKADRSGCRGCCTEIYREFQW